MRVLAMCIELSRIFPTPTRSPKHICGSPCLTRTSLEGKCSGTRAPEADSVSFIANIMVHETRRLLWECVSESTQTGLRAKMSWQCSSSQRKREACNGTASGRVRGMTEPMQYECTTTTLRKKGLSRAKHASRTSTPQGSRARRLICALLAGTPAAGS